ncbi:MAG: isoprenyl transferase [Elusimicrobia bacterium]|nr:isoprenyl transferase [Candidatus Liberimonas magnetica]
MPLKEKIDLSKLPRHIAIIMDGNGRWAKKRKLPRVFGHRAGIKSVRETVETCAELKIEVLTLYAFSTENWSRPKTEVNALMALLKLYLMKEFDNLMRNDIRLNAIGDILGLPEAPRKELLGIMEKTRTNKGLVLNLALNYGGRQEILNAVTGMIKDKVEKADEGTFKKYLYTSLFPDPDLLIRTSGEMRLSNFLLWQSAYTELYITEVLWPEFRAKNLYEAISDYQKRERRYGGI